MALPGRRRALERISVVTSTAATNATGRSVQLVPSFFGSSGGQYDDGMARRREGEMRPATM